MERVILTMVMVIICMFLLLLQKNLVYKWIWIEPSENSREDELYTTELLKGLVERLNDTTELLDILPAIQ